MTRKLLTTADKIAKLNGEDVEMINGYLKILKSHWRITLAEGEQLKRAVKSMKEGSKKIWDVISDD
jgi:hypothetical protein